MTVVDLRALEGATVQEVNARFGRFIAERVNPGAAARDRDGATYDTDLLREAGELGLWGYGLPTSVGGGGADRLRFGLALEQLGYLCEEVSFPLLLALRTMSVNALIETCSPYILENYVKPMARGEKALAFSYTEDADPFHFKSKAVKQSDGSYILNGVKRPVYGGATADTVLTYVSDNDGQLKVFLVERSDPGMELVPIEVGALRANGPCKFLMTDVRIPPERVVDDVDGVSHIQRSLNMRRLVMSLPGLGAMKQLHERVIGALEGTIRYGQPLSEHLIVQASIGRGAILVESARAFAHDTLQRSMSDENPFWDPSVSAAKYVIADHANRLVNEAFRPLATLGYIDPAYTRFQRDFAMLVTISGTLDSIETSIGENAVHNYRAAKRRK